MEWKKVKEAIENLGELIQCEECAVDYDIVEKYVNTGLKNEDDMILSAVRYALGRKTYIVSETVEYVENIFDRLSDRVKEVMLRDINEYLLVHRNDEQDMDLKEWVRLLEKLQSYKKEKEKWVE